jgi:HK97 family phage portal protein
MALRDRFLSLLRTPAKLARSYLVKGLAERVMSGLLFSSGGYGWPGAWSMDRREAVLHMRHWVYVAVDAIGKEVAGQAPNVANVHSDAPQGQQSKVISSSRLKRYQKTLQTIKPHEEVEPVEADHPLQRLFHKPNETDVSWQLWYELVMFLKLTGTGYLWAVPNGLGVPCELVVLPSHWVYPRLGRGKVIDHYEVIPWMGGLGSLKFPAEEIVYFRMPNPFHKVDGYSALQAGSDTIDAFESVQRSRFWSFKNGASPWGAIEFDKDVSPSPEDIDRWHSKFRARYAGETNAGLPMVMGPGMRFNPLVIAPTEMAYVESADQLRDWILSLFSVPKGVVGIEPGGDNLSKYADHAQFGRYCINPLLALLGQVLTEFLARRWDDSLRVWWNDSVPDDPAEARANVTLAAANGAIAPNEIRSQLLHLDPYPHGGDDPLVPQNLAEVPYVSGDTDGSLMAAALQAHRPPPPKLPVEEESPEENDNPKNPGVGLGEQEEQAEKTKSFAAPVGILAITDIRQEGDSDCGVASFRAACGALGVQVGSEDGVGTMLRTTEGGTGPAQIMMGAVHFGLATEEVRGMAALEESIRAKHPVLCCVQRSGVGHWVVVCGVTEGSVYVHDPVDGLKRVGRKLWLRRWHDTGADGTEYREYGIALSKQVHNGLNGVKGHLEELFKANGESIERLLAENRQVASVGVESVRGDVLRLEQRLSELSSRAAPVVNVDVHVPQPTKTTKAVKRNGEQLIESVTEIHEYPNNAVEQESAEHDS